MPGGNGTGPAGMGPMTGRGLGYCANYSAPGYMNPIVGGGFGRGMGRGGGFGRGMGVGRGFGRGVGRGSGATAYSYSSNLSSQQEASMLKDQLKAMQDEVNMVNNRIKELESSADSKKE